MTDTDFRISGGVSPDMSVEEIRALRLQVMHQGIGMNLRPVSNVPIEDSGDIINDDTVASGSFMQFMSEGWVEGKWHPRGSTVTNGEWTMVANTLTLDSPYPVPAGDQEFGTEPWTPVTQNDSSVVYSGHLYTITGACWARTLNVYVTQLTADTNYRIVIVTQFPGKDLVTSVLEEPVLTVGAWKTVALMNQLLPAGTTILAYIDALNSGADNEVTGGWSYAGQDNVAAPARGAWNQNNARTLLRIDKFDLDGTDRDSELEGIGVNSTLVFADTNNPAAFDQYRVRSEPPVDGGTYWGYDVVLQEQGEGGVPIGTTTMTATVPIPQPTEYAEEVGAVPTYTGPPVTAIGYLQFNGADQGGDANKYGIDIEFETTDYSEDWDVLAFNTP